MKRTLKKRTLLVSLVVALLLGGLTPLAADADSALTLTQARTLALAQSKTLRKTLLSVDAAKIDERLQAFTMLPSIAASVSGSANAPWTALSNALGASLGVTVTQTVFNGSGYVLSAISTLSTNLARSEARAEYFSVLDAADAAFSSAQEASASVEAAQSDLASALASQALAKAKLDAGMISSVAYMQQEAAAASKQAALVAARGTLSVATRTLASLTGLSLPLSIAAIDTAYYDPLMARVAALSDGQTDALVEKIRQAAEANNPAVAQADISRQMAVKAVDLARADYLPSVSASLSSGASVFGGFSASLGISASIGLDLWSTKATVDSKVVAAKQASLVLEETKRTTLISIQQSVYDAISSAKSVSSSETALQYAERAYENVQEQFRLSAATAADLSDAALLVSADRAALISARFQFLANLFSLRSLAGLESDELLAALIP